MNILIVGRGTPSQRDPQWGSFEFSQAQALAKLGHRVTIVSVDTRFRFYWRKLGWTTEERDSIRIYNLFWCPMAVCRLLGTRFTESVFRKLWRMMESRILGDGIRYDIIYSHYLFNSYYAVQCLTHLQAPVVVIEHWSEISRPHLRPAVQKMGQVVYDKADRIIAVSRATHDSILRHFGKESTIVHNMVDASFRYADEGAKKDSELFSLVSVSNLLPIKGHDTLIHALSKVDIPRDKWHLRIAGHGSERRHLQSLINRYHLQQNIQLVGQLDKTHIQELLSDADAFVLASRSETFGVAYIEALACGLPVIATKCGGPEEFVNDKNGLLVPVDDVDALASAIRYMYEHRNDYNRAQIAEECQSRFSSETIARQLIFLFEEVLSKASK